MTPSDKPTDAELVEIAKAAADVAPGAWEVDTENCEGEYGLGDDTTSGFRIPFMMDDKGRRLFDASNSDIAEVHEEYDEDGCTAWDENSRRLFAYLAAANPARVISLLERLQAAEAAQADFDDLFREYSLTLAALSTSEASRLSVERERDAYREYFEADRAVRLVGRLNSTDEQDERLANAIAALEHMRSQDPGPHPCADAGPVPALALATERLRSNLARHDAAVARYSKPDANATMSVLRSDVEVVIQHIDEDWFGEWCATSSARIKEHREQPGADVAATAALADYETLAFQVECIRRSVEADVRYALDGADPATSSRDLHIIPRVWMSLGAALNRIATLKAAEDATRTIPAITFDGGEAVHEQVRHPIRDDLKTLPLTGEGGE